MTLPLKLTEATVATASAALVAMTLTPSEVTAITIASSALLATVFTGIVNIIMALRSERKLDNVNAKADVITGHVNSAATASTAKIDSMQKQIEFLTRQIAEGKQTAAVLAQSKADVAIVEPIAATVELTTPKKET